MNLNQTKITLYTIYRISSIKTLILLFTICCLVGCKDDDENEIPVPPLIPECFLIDNQIIISNIKNIPDHITFAKVRAEISGDDWQIIEIIESTYENGEVTLTLPTTIPRDKLQKVVRDNVKDYAAHWFAVTNNNEARVAALKDINFYDEEDKCIGMVSLTDWDGLGTTVGKSWVYYHYTDQPYTLTTHEISQEIRNPGSYVFDTSFAVGWNIYSNIVLTEESTIGSIRCTTNIPETLTYAWHFTEFK